MEMVLVLVVSTSGGTSGNGIQTSGNSTTIQDTTITTGAGGAGGSGGSGAGAGGAGGNGIQTTANDTSIQKTTITTGAGGNGGSGTVGGAGGNGGYGIFVTGPANRTEIVECFILKTGQGGAGGNY